MSTFKFGEIRADVERLAPDPTLSSKDVYQVRISSPDENAWIENRLVMKKNENRTVASDFDMASGVIGNLYQAAMNPEAWREVLEATMKISPEEVNAIMDVAERLKPYLHQAVDVAVERFNLYSEAREGGVGPYNPELGIARSLELPEHIGDKEDIAQFFAYLYLVDNLSFHPDENFSSYREWKTGKRFYTQDEIDTRNGLMIEAFQAAEAENMDIYEIALWVGAVTGVNSDPENEAAAPGWLKALSSKWV